MDEIERLLNVNDTRLVARLNFGRDALLPLFESTISERRDHPQLRVTALKIAQTIPEELITVSSHHVFPAREGLF